MKPTPVSSALFLISELYPNLSPDDAEAIAERLMDYVGDCEKTTRNFWIDGPRDIQ
jgi:hypothetical protein